MAAISSKRMNWVPKPSTWQDAEAWRLKRAQMREAYLSANAAAASNFTSAWSNEIQGMGDLAARMASDRMAAERRAKYEALKALF